jgi:catechol-2,3-dioxygenase
MTTVRLGAVSLDAADPRPLADFYRHLLGADTIFESEDFIALKTAGIFLTVQRVADHRPLTGPTGRYPNNCTWNWPSTTSRVPKARPLSWAR